MELKKWQRPCEKAYRKRYVAKHREWIKRRRKELYAWQPWIGIFRQARARCTNPNSAGYYHYGARGIKFKMVVQEVEYLWFRDLAGLMVDPSLDRIDNDGDYTIENSRFIPRSENSKKSLAERVKQGRSDLVLRPTQQRLNDMAECEGDDPLMLFASPRKKMYSKLVVRFPE